MATIGLLISGSCDDSSSGEPRTGPLTAGTVVATVIATALGKLLLSSLDALTVALIVTGSDVWRAIFVLVMELEDVVGTFWATALAFKRSGTFAESGLTSTAASSRCLSKNSLQGTPEPYCT